MALNGKSVDLSKVVSMIDETVPLVKAELGEDDGKKANCTESFGQTEDEAKILTHEVSGRRDAIADTKEQLSNVDGSIAAVEKSISELDESVAHETVQERILERIVEEIIGFPFPQVMEKIVEVGKVIPQERIHDCTPEQFVDVPIPQIRKEIGEVIQPIQHEQVFDRNGKVRPEIVFERTVEQVYDLKLRSKSCPCQFHGFVNKRVR